MNIENFIKIFSAFHLQSISNETQNVFLNLLCSIFTHFYNSLPKKKVRRV